MSKVTNEVKRFGRKIEDDVAPDVKPGEPDATPGSAASELAPKNERIEGRAAQFETRKQALGQRAAAAGATRSDNDADVLGYAAPRRRSAARAILG